MAMTKSEKEGLKNPKRCELCTHWHLATKSKTTHYCKIYKQHRYAFQTCDRWEKK